MVGWLSSSNLAAAACMLYRAVRASSIALATEAHWRAEATAVTGNRLVNVDESIRRITMLCNDTQRTSLSTLLLSPIALSYWHAAVRLSF